jgi:hypothetical protein
MEGGLSRQSTDAKPLDGAQVATLVVLGNCRFSESSKSDCFVLGDRHSVLAAIFGASQPQ